MSSPVLQRIQTKARELRKLIALCDAEDLRVIEAARIATDEKLARIALVGNAFAIESTAAEAGIPLRDIQILDPTLYVGGETLAAEYHERRKYSEPLRSTLEEVANNPLLFAALLARAHLVDGVVAGSISTTGSVVRAALRGIGLEPDLRVLSSIFLLHFEPIPGYRDEHLLFGFADCSVVPEPSAEQLCDIAIATSRTYRTLTGIEPRVAMLSFSTKGSASTASTIKVIEATALARAQMPDLLIDGELQFDAAFVPSVAARKAPGSVVAGSANVFVFPNLDAGNLCYKIAERLGMGAAIGPILQGLAQPMNDLSRGASVSDIVHMIAITAVQSGEKS